MKYLSDYMQEKQTAAFDHHGGFFAFSNKQFDEQKKADVVYIQLGSGLIAPKSNAAALVKALEQIHSDAIKQDITENGIKAIIWRELANHECQITMDYSDAFYALEGYGIAIEQVKTEYTPYFQNCVKNDYF